MNHQFTKDTEVELKYLIQSDQELKTFENFLLTQHAQLNTVLKQKNYFFDTKELLLHRHQMICRLRHENKNYILTFKAKSESIISAPKDVAIRKEKEWSIDLKTAQLILDGKINPLLWAKQHYDSPLASQMLSIVQKSGDELLRVGNFQNKRHVYTLKYELQNLKIEIDRSIFLDKFLRFEIECECSDSAMLNLAQHFISNGLTKLNIISVYPKGKSTEFFTLMKLNHPSNHN